MKKINQSFLKERRERLLHIVDTYDLRSNIIAEMLNIPLCRVRNMKYGVTFFRRIDEYALLRKIRHRISLHSEKISTEIDGFDL